MNIAHAFRMISTVQVLTYTCVCARARVCTCVYVSMYVCITVSGATMVEEELEDTQRNSRPWARGERLQNEHVYGPWVAIS